MRRIITKKQESDMGSGFGEYEFDKNTTLEEFLQHYKNTIKAWGTCTIIHKSGEILRKFDFDLYNNNNIFYTHLSGWELNYKLKSIKFSYCFMSENLEVILND